MAFDDVRDDDSGDWAPLFGANTPSDEVQALADASAQQCVADLREQVAAQLQLTPAGRAVSNLMAVFNAELETLANEVWS